MRAAPSSCSELQGKAKDLESIPPSRGIPPPGRGYPKVSYGGKMTRRLLLNSFPDDVQYFARLFLAVTALWANIGELSRANPTMRSPSSAHIEMAQIISPRFIMVSYTGLPVHTGFWDSSKVPHHPDDIWLPKRPELLPLTLAVLLAKARLKGCPVQLGTGGADTAHWAHLSLNFLPANFCSWESEGRLYTATIFSIKSWHHWL